ncbi:unnamed protein product [Ectocarpus fasciculatus]
MDVIQDILKNGPIAAFPFWTRGVLISLFLCIVCTLLCMLIVLLIYGSHINIQFGY